MPSPLSQSSSQEIIPISPPLASFSSSRLTTLPSALPFDPPADLKPRIHAALKTYKAKEEGQNGKRKARASEVEEERKRIEGMGRSRVTDRMVSLLALPQPHCLLMSSAATDKVVIQMKTMGKGVNPITDSDLYSR